MTINLHPRYIEKTNLLLPLDMFSKIILHSRNYVQTIFWLMIIKMFEKHIHSHLHLASTNAYHIQHNVNCFPNPTINLLLLIMYSWIVKINIGLQNSLRTIQHVHYLSLNICVICMSIVHGVCVCALCFNSWLLLWNNHLWWPKPLFMHAWNFLTCKYLHSASP